MNVESVVSKAFQDVEKLEPEEFEELKRDFSRYEALRNLVRKVAEEDKRIAAALQDKIEAGDDESIELELSKICSPEKLKNIKHSLETETFHMYIAKIDGADTVTTKRNGKDVFSPIKIETIEDVRYADALQWASILIEIVILVGDCVGIHLHISASRMKSVANGVSKMLQTSAMKRAMQTFISDWNANAKALARARAIFDLLRASYSARILWNTYKLICQDMSPADWARTAAVLTASVIAAFSTGGTALIAKIVMALNGAYNLAKKITNIEHLSAIEAKLAA